MNKCPHCGGDIAVRNPTGKCDHLYYPDYCEVCSEIEHLKKTKIPRCTICKKDYKKINEHQYEPTCDCIKKEIRLCMG